MTALLALLVGCGLGTSPAAPSGAVPFPHPDGYDAGLAHGPEVRSAGAETCLGCHREDSSAPTCESCHAGYPHVEGWLAGSAHGVGLTGDAGVKPRAVCEGCHGVEGMAAPTCTSCHTSWPHPEGWELAGAHGAWVLARGSAVAACGSCHGAALEGTAQAPSCTSCHAGWPHPEGWAQPTAHGAADLTTCAACHGELGTGGSSGVACSRCHAAYPHPAGFAAGHLAPAQAVGEAVCLDCHDAGGGPVLPVGCAPACHGGAR